jgi:hypothetical protein
MAEGTATSPAVIAAKRLDLRRLMMDFHSFN